MTYARRESDAGHVAPRAAAPVERRGHRTTARLLGAVGLVLLIALLFWMLTDEAFTVTPESVTFRGLAHADEERVRSYLGELDRGPNVFRVRASEIVGHLADLPEVDAATARVRVPAGVSVALDERDPVFIWSDGAVTWLVDEEGMLFAPIEQASDSDAAAGDDAGSGDGAAPEDAATAVAARTVEEGTSDEVPAASGPGAALRASLPLVLDARTPDELPALGSYLPADDLDIMRLLLAVTPETLGSREDELLLRIDENDGYTLSGAELGWRAIFGHYYPTIQTPDVIPRQVQCLEWLLGEGERRLEQAWLALSDEACGTSTQLDVGRGGGG
jgi:hypothetical protein